MRFNHFWTPKGRRPKVRLAPSHIPPRDWKYWCMVVLSLAWFVLLTTMLWKSTYAPSATQWWKEQARNEQNRKGAFPAPEPTQGILADSKMPFPKEGDYFKLNFDILSNFPAGTPDLAAPPTGRPAKEPFAQVPGAVRSLDGHKISVAGFMIPMIMEKDSVSSFILAQSRMTCCYGVVPKLNQWIFVTMGQGKSTQQFMDVPVTVFGTIDVGPKYDEENKGWCLYRMTGDKVELPKKSWF